MVKKACRQVALLFVGLCTAWPNPANSQSLAESFGDLWSDFMLVCGSLISDPELAFTSPPTASGVPLTTWHVNFDETIANGDYYSESLGRSGIFYVAKRDSGHDVLCQYDGADYTQSESVEVLSQNVRKFLLEIPDIITKGGKYRNMLSQSDIDYFAYIVEGTLSEKKVAIKIEISAGQYSLGLFTNIQKNGIPRQ